MLETQESECSWIVADTVVDGRYELVSLIGQGGAGSVWKAFDRQFKRMMALKFMVGPNTPESLARFRRETQVCGQLASPHLVSILDYGVYRKESGEQTPYLLMPLLEGETLSRRIARQGRLSPHETLALMTQVARGLSVMHTANLFHRDLKPDNIFICPNGDSVNVVLVDLGLARLVTPLSPITQQPAFLGTPHYSSPEQLHFSNQRCDHRADLWSLAVTTYQCLTGELPFQVTSLPMLKKLLSGPRPVPSVVSPVPVPPGFDGWFAKAVAPELFDRFKTAKSQTDALRLVCAPGLPKETLSAVPFHGLQLTDPRTPGALSVPTGETDGKQSTPNGRRALAAVGLFAAGALAAGTLQWVGGQARPERPERPERPAAGGQVAQSAPFTEQRSLAPAPAAPVAALEPAPTDLGPVLVEAPKPAVQAPEKAAGSAEQSKPEGEKSLASGEAKSPADGELMRLSAAERRLVRRTRARKAAARRAKKRKPKRRSKRAESTPDSAKKQPTPANAADKTPSYPEPKMVRLPGSNDLVFEF